MHWRGHILRAQPPACADTGLILCDSIVLLKPCLRIHKTCSVHWKTWVKLHTCYKLVQRKAKLYVLFTLTTRETSKPLQLCNAVLQERTCAESHQKGSSQCYLRASLLYKTKAWNEIFLVPILKAHTELSLHNVSHLGSLIMPHKSKKLRPLLKLHPDPGHACKGCTVSLRLLRLFSWHHTGSCQEPAAVTLTQHHWQLLGRDQQTASLRTKETQKPSRKTDSWIRHRT